MLHYSTAACLIFFPCFKIPAAFAWPCLGLGERVPSPRGHGGSRPWLHPDKPLCSPLPAQNRVTAKGQKPRYVPNLSAEFALVNPDVTASPESSGLVRNGML